jgi:signal transduction histidine kinase/CheY-like chemotaxis protein
VVEKLLMDGRRTFRRLAAGATVVLVAVGIFFALSLSASHARYRSRANDDLQNLTLNLERYLYVRFHSADAVLASAAQAFKQLSAQPPVPEERFTEVLRGLQRLLPDEPSLRASDGTGQVVYGDGIVPTQKLSVEQRQFFKEAKATPGLVVGLPLKSRITKRWVLPLARELRTAQGEFAGVVYVNLDMQEFADMLRSLKIGDKGVITLFNQRREVLARLPENASQQDEAPLRLSAPETLAALATGKSTASFDAHSSIDQQLRALMYRQVGNYPVYILAGLAHDEFLAPWYRELAITLLFWLALAAGAILLLVTQHRAGVVHSLALTELRAAKHQADAASESKSLFLANMSHEIRTPLNGVLGFAQIGYRDPTSSEQARESFARILESGKLLQGILNDVLDMSKIEAGKLTLDAVPTRVRPAAAHAVSLVQGVAQHKGIALRLTISEQLPEQVVVDPLRLEQILLNLLSNAVKFTEAGHVDLTIGMLEGDLLIEVGDSGLGMSDEQLGRLFASFEQADRSTTRRYGGTGLGLAITKRLVDLMKGSIQVSSQAGVGSVFTVRLPVAAVPDDEPGRVPTPGSPVPPIAEAPGLRLVGLRVLVAEDDAVNQLVIQRLLTMEGATTEVVGDGHEAVQRVARQQDPRYDIALLDVMMPGIDGYETARRIHLLDAGLPIIGQTAHALPEDRALCIEAGMVERVTKPLIAEVLVQAILTHRRQIQRNAATT